MHHLLEYQCGHGKVFTPTSASALCEQAAPAPSIYTKLNLIVICLLFTWILIYSHNLSYQQVLHHLLDHGLYAKAEKCEFHKTELSFLGYLIGPWGVGMEENKVLSMSAWLQPTKVKELQFLGFVNFYHQFICSFSSLVASLTNLLKGKPKRVGLRAVLSQVHGEPSKLHQCAFFLWKLTLAERNYDIVTLSC